MTERVKFEAWLFGEHTLPNQSIPYAAEEVMFELWQKLQACAEQKDKEIAELRLRPLHHHDCGCHKQNSDHPVAGATPNRT